MLANHSLSKYVSKLERRQKLLPEEHEALLTLHGERRDYTAGETILAEGEPATHCVIIDAGLVSRVKKLEDGARQIVAFHLDGDAVDLQSVLFAACDHDIRSHMPTRTFWVAHKDILTLAQMFPNLSNALWLDTLVDSAIFREWTANVGQRNARERIAHLFLELAARLDAIGLVTDDSYHLPVTQTNLAEALGLSLVHMNKSLQALHREGLLTFKERRVFLKDKERLTEMCGFKAEYLHLDGSRVKKRGERLGDGEMISDRAEVRVSRERAT